MLKNSSNNDLMQSPNITTTSMPSNPFSNAAAAAAASTTTKTSSTSSAASINPSAGTGDTYLNKNENVLKD